MAIDVALEQSELGKKTDYPNQYNPELLFPIARKIKRKEIGVEHAIPFFGYDIWNHYEVSWLNPKGKPIVALAQIIFDCASDNIIESKSMKLYFNSFNQTHFNDVETLQEVIKMDLQQRLNTPFIDIRLHPLHLLKDEMLACRLAGTYLDELDVECVNYHTTPDYLTTEPVYVEETVYSDLLKSNCLVTHQPDWCSVQISYKGRKISHAGLLRYLVSFRNDNEFHEQCIEKIFMHIFQRCKPKELTVYGRSTRRGGLDINSYRATNPIDANKISNIRLCRQ